MDTEFTVQKQDCTRYYEECAAILTSREQVGVSYTENSLEFTEVCEDLWWKHDKSTRTDPKRMDSAKERSEECDRYRYVI